MEVTDVLPVEVLKRIDARTSEIQAVLEQHGGMLRTVIERLNLLIDLLAPKEGNRDGIPLDELLAHLIRQNAEQLMLTRGVLEALQKLGKELPDAVIAAMAENGGAETRATS